MTQINVVKQKYAFVPQLRRYYKLKRMIDINDSGILRTMKRKTNVPK